VGRETRRAKWRVGKRGARRERGGFAELGRPRSSHVGEESRLEVSKAHDEEIELEVGAELGRPRSSRRGGWRLLSASWKGWWATRESDAWIAGAHRTGEELHGLSDG
jgi:hypothetical protein